MAFVDSFCRTGSTIEDYADAASKTDKSVEPKEVKGGVFADASAASAKSSSSKTASGSESTSSSSAAVALKQLPGGGLGALWSGVFGLVASGYLGYGLW